MYKAAATTPSPEMMKGMSDVRLVYACVPWFLPIAYEVLAMHATPKSKTIDAVTFADDVGSNVSTFILTICIYVYAIKKFTQQIY